MYSKLHNLHFCVQTLLNVHLITYAGALCGSVNKKEHTCLYKAVPYLQRVPWEQTLLNQIAEISVGYIAVERSLWLSGPAVSMQLKFSV